MTVVLDAGALIAFERRDRAMIARLIEAQTDEEPVITSAGAVAQVLRDPAREVALERILRGVDEVPLDSAAARHIGRLLARTSTSDVVAAAVAIVARSGDEIFTSDPHDMAVLAEGSSVTVRAV